MKKSILTRLIITFLCVITPLYIIGISIYMWGADTLRNSITNVMQSQGGYYMDGLEKDIQRIQSLQYDLVTDSNLNKLCNLLPIMSKYDKSVAIQNLIDRLNAIANSNSMIDKIKLHLPDLGKSIYSTGFVTELEKSEYTFYKNLKAHTERQVIMSEGVPHLLMSGDFEDTNDKSYNAYIVDIQFKVSELNKSLAALETYHSGGAFIMDSKTGEVIAVDGDLSITGKLMKRLPKDNVEKNHISRIIIDKKSYLVTGSYSKYMDFVLVKYVLDQEVFSQMKKYQVWFWILTIAAIIVIILYSTFTLKFIGRPVGKLVHYFRKAEDGDLKTMIDYKFSDEFGYLYQGFNRMMNKLDHMIQQVYEQKILVQKAELKQLQSQINPHFLYNSFFIFHRTILSGDMDNAAELSEKMGNYFKYITKNSTDNVLLKAEVEHARIYSEIQALRFENRLTVEFGELLEKYEHIQVPRLLLQPILENSFEHGMKTKIRNGRIIVSFKEDENFLFISVEDNGDQANSQVVAELSEKLDDEEGNGEISGLMNINRRIRLMFGKNSGLSVCRSDMGGLKVLLTLEIKNIS